MSRTILTCIALAAVALVAQPARAQDAADRAWAAGNVEEAYRDAYRLRRESFGRIAMALTSAPRESSVLTTSVIEMVTNGVVS